MLWGEGHLGGVGVGWELGAPPLPPKTPVASLTLLGSGPAPRVPKLRPQNRSVGRPLPHSSMPLPHPSMSLPLPPQNLGTSRPPPSSFPDFGDPSSSAPPPPRFGAFGGPPNLPSPSKSIGDPPRDLGTPQILPLPSKPAPPPKSRGPPLPPKMPPVRFRFQLFIASPNFGVSQEGHPQICPHFWGGPGCQTPPILGILHGGGLGFGGHPLFLASPPFQMFHFRGAPTPLDLGRPGPHFPHIPHTRNFQILGR